MAFPKKMLWCFPEGWMDLGERLPTFSESGDLAMRKLYMHSFCQTPVHLGKEDDSDELFVFCPHCMVKTDNLK